MPQVSPVRTPTDAHSLRDAFERQWSERFGEPIRPGVLALLMALADFETAFRPVHWNLGNIILPAEYLPTTQQSWFVLHGDEGADAGAGDAEHHYKVYTSLDAGALALITQLTRPSRQQWWDGLKTEDPEQFVRALGGENGGPRYFEARLPLYLERYLGRYAKYTHLLPSGMPSNASALSATNQGEVPAGAHVSPGARKTGLLGFLLLTIGGTIWAISRKSG